MTTDRSGEDWSDLFEFLPIGAYRSSPEGRMLRANMALARLNGCESPAQLLAGVSDIAGEWYVDPARRAEFVRQIERHGHVAGFESEVHRHCTRERIWVRENAHAVRDAQGRVRWFEGTVEEITERVRDREALARSEARLQQLVALIPGVVYRLAIEPDGRRHYSFVSDHVRELYGLEPAEVLADGEALVRFRHPDHAEGISKASRHALDHELPLHYEVRLLLRDGTEKWVQVNSAPGPGEGRTRERVGVLLDVTERKRAEAALQQQATLWKHALEAGGDGVWDWHVQDGVEILSPECKALYGFAPDELPDTPSALDERTHPEDLAQMAVDREAHFAGRTARYVNEHRVRCKDGSWKWILSRGIVISRDAQGRPLRMIGTHTDITAAKQAEALRLERDRAAAADVAKSQFLSRVSHELRTPLNAILGFAQLLELEGAQLGERQQAWVQQVLGSGRHLLSLMDDILDLSSAQTGRLVVVPEAVTLAPVVQEAWAMLAGAAAAQPVQLIDELPPALVLRADRKRLKQVMSNLLSNAIKYNRPGGWVRLRAADDGGPMVELQVVDTGSGLTPEQQGRLFNAFDRLGAERGPVPGTGLGLALTRQLVEAMGGRVGVESEPGVGSTFCVWLPRA